MPHHQFSERTMAVKKKAATSGKRKAPAQTKPARRAKGPRRLWDDEVLAYSQLVECGLSDTVAFVAIGTTVTAELHCGHEMVVDTLGEALWLARRMRRESLREGDSADEALRAGFNACAEVVGRYLNRTLA